MVLVQALVIEVASALIIMLLRRARAIPCIINTIIMDQGRQFRC